MFCENINNFKRRNPFPTIMLLVDIVDKLFDLVFFSQERIGLESTTFKIWKIPTMQKGREDEYASLKETHGLDRFGYINDDPRLTYFGKYLRIHHLDELPQLWNVLKGDMRLTGPRPLIREEYDKLSDELKELRRKVKPGTFPIFMFADYLNIKTVEDLRNSEMEYLKKRVVDPWTDYKYFLKTVHTMSIVATNSMKMNIYRWTHSIPYF